MSDETPPPSTPPSPETEAAAAPTAALPASPAAPEPADETGRESSAQIARRALGAPAPDGVRKAPQEPAAAAPPDAEPESESKLLRRLGDTQRAHRQAMQQLQELQQRVAAREEQERALQTDPLGALAKLGWDQDRISQALLEKLGTDKPDPVQQTRAELEALKAQLQERDQLTQRAQADAQRERQVAWLRDWCSQQGERTALISTLGIEPLLHERITERVRAEGLRGTEVDAALGEEADALCAQWYSPVERQVRTLVERHPRFRSLVLELARAAAGAPSPAEPDSRTHREPPLAPPTRRPASTASQPRSRLGSPAERTAETVANLSELLTRRR